LNASGVSVFHKNVGFDLLPKDAFEISWRFNAQDYLRSCHSVFRGLIPPLSLQQQFAARVAEVCVLEECQRVSRDRLDDLFQSLLHRAFTGEL
jgi:hypothetical protein